MIFTYPTIQQFQSCISQQNVELVSPKYLVNPDYARKSSPKFPGLVYNEHKRRGLRENFMIVHHYIQASVDHLDRCEDAVVILAVPEHAPVFAVIDGMGGHQHRRATGSLVSGREAASMAREALIEILADLPADADSAPGGATEKKLLDAMAQAHDRIYSILNGGDSLPDHHRVGAVLTVAIVCENGKRVLAGQVGDTRCYIQSGDKLTQLIADEDNVEFLVKAGIISAEDGERVARVMNLYDGVNDPKVEGAIKISDQTYELDQAWRWFLFGNHSLAIPGANVVMRAIGIDNEVPPPVLSRADLKEGDSVILCTDGIYKNLSEPEMLTYLKATNHVDRAALLGEAAFARSRDITNRRSTKDDIAVVVGRP